MPCSFNGFLWIFSGSCTGWCVVNIITQLAVYTALLPVIYCLLEGYINSLPPIARTRKIHCFIFHAVRHKSSFCARIIPTSGPLSTNATVASHTRKLVWKRCRWWWCWQKQSLLQFRELNPMFVGMNLTDRIFMLHFLILVPWTFRGRHGKGFPLNGFKMQVFCMLFFLRFNGVIFGKWFGMNWCNFLVNYKNHWLGVRWCRGSDIYYQKVLQKGHVMRVSTTTCYICVSPLFWGTQLLMFNHLQ